MTEPFVGNRFHDDVLETWLNRIGGDAGTGLPNPLAHGTIGIVVEAVHAFGSHATFFCIAVPPFPNGGGTVVYGIKPAGVLALEKKCVGHICHVVVG